MNLYPESHRAAFRALTQACGATMHPHAKVSAKALFPSPWWTRDVSLDAVVTDAKGTVLLVARLESGELPVWVRRGMARANIPELEISGREYVDGRKLRRKLERTIEGAASGRSAKRRLVEDKRALAGKKEPSGEAESA